MASEICQDDLICRTRLADSCFFLPTPSCPPPSTTSCLCPLLLIHKSMCIQLQCSTSLPTTTLCVCARVHIRARVCDSFSISCGISRTLNYTSSACEYRQALTHSTCIHDVCVDTHTLLTVNLHVVFKLFCLSFISFSKLNKLTGAFTVPQ